MKLVDLGLASTSGGRDVGGGGRCRDGGGHAGVHESRADQGAERPGHLGQRLQVARCSAVFRCWAVQGYKVQAVRSDLYNLGATLFHLVTGRVPYGGKSVAEAMHRHASVADPSCPCAGVVQRRRSPAAWTAIVRKLMAWSREDRYRSPGRPGILDLTRMLRGARPLIAELAPEALAPLAVGEAAGARPPDVAVPRPRCGAGAQFPTEDAIGGLPVWVSLLLFSGVTLSLLMTAAVLIVVSG